MVVVVVVVVLILAASRLASNKRVSVAIKGTKTCLMGDIDR